MLPEFKSASLETVLATLEVQRKKIVSNKTKGWGAIVLGILILLLLFALNQQVIGLIVGSASALFGIIILYRIGDEIKLYRSSFKQEVISTVLSSVNPTFKIEPENGVSEREFIESQLFKNVPDRYHTEDLVSGKADKTSFSFAEVHAEYKTETQTKNGRQVHWHEILKGIIFIADFNKNFNGITVVRPKDLGSSIGAWFSKNLFSIGHQDIVELESEYFNKNFATYSSDQIEARYILTPALMEKIADLNERSSYCISLSFMNSCVYIAFPLENNYFEPPVFKSLLKPDLLDNDISILNFMYDIVRELDLNTRIWTKQ